MNKNFSRIIDESISHYLTRNIITEKKSKKDYKKEDDKDEDEGNEKDDEDENDDSKPKNKKKFRKNAIKGKGGLRKDFDTETDETYNKNVDDQEQSSVKNLLTNGFINIKKVAEKLYPDHTPEGAQSQLNKKLRGDKSDSGSTYKLKSKEVKRLRHIIASYLNN